jgi:hypothetical protein
MKDRQKRYPDNTPIFKLKSEGRSQRAAVPFAQKLAALDALVERVEPIVRAREQRKQANLSRGKTVARRPNSL